MSDDESQDENVGASGVDIRDYSPHCGCARCEETRELAGLRVRVAELARGNTELLWERNAARSEAHAAGQRAFECEKHARAVEHVKDVVLEERDRAREDAAAWKKAADQACQACSLFCRERDEARDERAKVADHRDRLIESNRGLRAAQDELIAEIRRLRIKLGKIATEARGD